MYVICMSNFRACPATSTSAHKLDFHSLGFVRSVKEECLSTLILIGPGMLERSLREYVKHYHRGRNH